MWDLRASRRWLYGTYLLGCHACSLIEVYHCISLNQKVHYHVRMSPPLVTDLNQIHLVHNLTPCWVNLKLASLVEDYRLQFLYSFLACPLHAPIPNPTEMRPAVDTTSLLRVNFMHTVHRKHKNLKRYATIAVFITLRYSS